MTSSTKNAVRLGLALLVLGLAPVGCSSEMMGATDLASPNVPESRGQMILFVGTDPESLTSELYLAQAVDSGDPNRLEDTGPDIIEAESFEIENLTASLSGSMPQVAAEALEVFAHGAPFPVPDRTGSLVALLAKGRTEGPSEGSARPYLLDLEQRRFTEGPLLPGLSAVHFTWAGGFLILEQYLDTESEHVVTSLVPTLALSSKPVLAIDDPNLDVRFAGLERGSNRILLEVSDPEAGSFDVFLFDPDLDELRHLTEGLNAPVSDPILSPDGSQLALTLTDPDSGLRSILVFPISEGPNAGWLIGDEPGEECFWPTWQPLTAETEAPNLACVCQDEAASRPDIVRWFAGMESAPSLLTSGPQPDLFEGSMNGLTLRSRPQWDPSGTLLVFGASTQKDALDGEAMTLVALPLDASSAYPIFTADEGSSGWAHFSSALTKPHLLVWDRAETGLFDSQGGHPIQVVVVDEPGRAAHPVVLGRDLFVAYPQYLGANTMLYP